jgi:hypothetical protein
MQFGSIEVEVRNGFVVAARDQEGHRWSAAGRGQGSRLFSHVVVMGAVLAPFMVTAASAHQALPGGRADARMLVLPAELVAEREHRVVPVEAPSPSPSPTAAVLGPGGRPLPPRPFAATAPVAGGGGHFSFGWCTWYVSTKRYVPWMGNAIEWWPNAARMGFPEGSTPRAGAIMVTRESGYGHVAYVEAVDADGRGWTVSEMNFRGFGVVSSRHIRMGQVPLVGFIY